MDKIESYIVAGHGFRVIIPEGEHLWRDIAPAYSPFAAPLTGQPLFEVTVTDSIPPEDASLILRDSNPREEEAKLDVWRTAQGYLFAMRTPFTDRQNCQLHISDDFRTARVTLSGNRLERFYGLNSALMLAFLLATAQLDTVLMHASAVVKDEKAYLFLGRSGTGKSTHSRLWLQAIAGTTLLNDDHPILRIDAQGSVIAYGSPWSGKTPCYHNASAPVGGIVRIRRATENRIRRLSPIESYASLLPGSSGMLWQKELADCKDNTLQKIITGVACWTLECLPDEAAALLCASTAGKEEPCNG
ncbi:hypothetical protein [Bacteroides sp.]|uniref:hypothetical protein n=1 Tax=Bacteroides sp. TaxID=29523 RepID=UPI002612623C|nr:hypothetical protein [Bacteroides sp.]MDD3038787.1 hypothetical protein [Bacteroides sp.]